MSILRQLPELCLRGALATQTMANLTVEQRLETERLALELANHETLQPTKRAFCKRLANTIGADYHDHAAAEQEFFIAVWRGVVYLLYDASYSYYCDGCGDESYTSANGKEMPFNRQYDCCPSCGCIQIQYHDGPCFMSGLDYEVLESRLGLLAPLARSPIVAVRGVEREANAATILEDMTQMRKFFVRFIKNYSQQLVNENKIQVTGNSLVTVTGPNDQIAAQSIMAVFKRNRISCVLNPPGTQSADAFVISFDPRKKSPSLMNEVIEVSRRYLGKMSDMVKIGVSEVYVPDLRADALLITAEVFSPRRAKVDYIQSEGDEMSGSLAVDRDIIEEEFNDIETSDWLQHVQSSMDRDCRRVFNMITGRGGEYKRYLDTYPEGLDSNGIPRTRLAAGHLGMSVKRYGILKEHIKIGLLDHLAIQ